MYKNGEGYNDPTAGAAIAKANNVDKNILVQLCSLKKELEDIRKRIEKNNREIEKLEKMGVVVTDSVTCGKKGKKPLGTKTITGFPYPEYEKRIRFKRVYGNQLQREETKYDYKITQAERYIESISDSRIRRICRYKCMDDTLTWVQIAHRMGKPHTAESCRQAFEREIGIRK